MDENNQQQENDQPEKETGSKTKKDLLGEALDSEFKNEDTMTGFVAEIQSKHEYEVEEPSSQGRPSDNSEPESDAFIVSEVESKHVNAEDDESELPEDSENEDKKDLSSDSHQIYLSPMEEQNVSKVEPSEITQEDFRESEGGGGALPKVLATLLVLALLIGGLYLFMSTGPKEPVLYLSESPVQGTDISSTKDNQTFSMGNAIYIYFAPAEKFSTTSVTLKVTELTGKALTKKEPEQTAPADSSESSNEQIIALHEHKVTPGVHKIYTLFQDDYFSHPGTYRLQVLDEKGSTLGENTFTIE